MNYEEEFALYKHISKMADAYVSLETILKKHGVTADSALHEAQQYRTDFFAQLAAWNIPADHLPTVCTEIIRRIEENPDSEQLRWLYCRLVTDAGLFYSLWERGEEQIIRNYYRQRESADRLMQEDRQVGQYDRDFGKTSQ